MSELLRLALIIAAAGVLLTLAAAVATRLLTEARRLDRAFRQGLGARPDASLIAHGAGRGVALSLEARRIVTAWDRGGWRMVYPLEDLIGAELDLDGDVAARAVRGEAPRRLDRTSGAEREVRLRLLFDDARHPDFDLVLWPSQAARGGFAKPREAIAEANRWVARVEAILRRAGPTASVAPRQPAPPSWTVAAPNQEPPPWDEDDLDDEAGDADEPAER